MKTVYISYFGAIKPLSQSQVVPYLRGLAAQGIGVTLVSFEERLNDRDEEAVRREALKNALDQFRIDWVPLRYHKRPSLPATAFDVVVGTAVTAYLVLRHGIDVVHVRNHVPALIGLIIKALFGTKLVFDLRGVMAEEYVEAGLWKEGGFAFRVVKWVEAQALTHADAIVMLTHRIRRALLERSPGFRSSKALVAVIPTCVEVDAYSRVDRRTARAQLNIRDEPVMVYSGSLGGWYMSSAMVDFFVAAQRLFPRLLFMVLTQSDFDLIQRELAARSLDSGRYRLRRVDHSSIPTHLVAADFGVSFIRPGYSKWSSSPTKIGEYLASGLPVVTGAGIGDVDALVESERVGVIVESLALPDYPGAAAQLAELLREGPRLRERCRRVALEQLSLERVGWPSYLQVYESLEGRRT